MTEKIKPRAMLQTKEKSKQKTTKLTIELDEQGHVTIKCNATVDSSDIISILLSTLHGVWFGEVIFKKSN